MLAKMSVERFQSRVARWFILKPKIPIRVHFGAPWKGKCFYIYDHLEYFMAIWYNLWHFGIVGGQLLYSYHFGMFGPRKFWQQCFRE
jgi:hypothetical protein